MFPPQCRSLPASSCYEDDDQYVNDLITFVTSSDIFQILSGEVHILDFLDHTPDLYEDIFESSWREWFELHDMDTLIGFFLREDLGQFTESQERHSWHSKPSPPRSLVQYISSIRNLALNRSFYGPSINRQMTRQLAVGMKPKKIHEVDHFARYVEALATRLESSGGASITHLVDFGAGQGYLGRFLASEPYERLVVALESKPHNVESARKMDVSVKLAPKTKTRRNKKQWREEQALASEMNDSTKRSNRSDFSREAAVLEGEEAVIDNNVRGKGLVQHVKHKLEDGHLDHVIPLMNSKDLATNHDRRPEHNDKSVNPRLLVLSLHSCGNLSHHALKSLVLNREVRAVAVVGCCYNLLTERLRPPSYKSEYLRPAEALDKPNRCAGDPHGFPMSQRLCDLPAADGKGVMIGIAARMMAVQAPTNWTRDEAQLVFTRHFYRALLQRLFLDHGVVQPPVPRDEEKKHFHERQAGSPAGGGGNTQPIVIGNLGKESLTSFTTYTRRAIKKLRETSQLNDHDLCCLEALTDAAINDYSKTFEHRRKHIGITWTLMALSATLIESTIVIDRWLWLREQECVERCWVEPVFSYSESPRNLVVVGVKRP